MARAVRTPRNSSVEALKPTPPVNLWEELDALCIDLGMERSIKQPPGTFTAAQYGRECGLHPSSVSLRFQRLIKEGKLEYMGKGNNNEKFYRIKK